MADKTVSHRPLFCDFLYGEVDGFTQRVVSRVHHLTQNVEDLLRSEQARGMVGNSDYIMMLNQTSEDLRMLAGMLGISETLMKYVVGADPGSGLIFAEKTIVPFVDRFPTESYLYKLMSTKFGEDMTQSEISAVIDGLVNN